MREIGSSSKEVGSIENREYLYRTVLRELGIDAKDGLLTDMDVTIRTQVVDQTTFTMIGTETTHLPLIRWNLSNVSLHMAFSEHLREIAYELQSVWKVSTECCTLWDFRRVPIANMSEIVSRMTDHDTFMLAHLLMLFPARTFHVVLAFDHELGFVDRMLINSCVALVRRMCCSSMNGGISVLFTTESDSEIYDSLKHHIDVKKDLCVSNETSLH